MAGNVTVKAGATTLGVLSASGAINGVPEFFPLGLGIIYKYANLTLPYSPNDPGLQYTYDNSANTPHVNLAARFFNLLNEPSTGVTFDAGSAAVGASVSGVQTDVGPDCLNVLDFGAVGDGITNDTAPIQCALDQAAKNYNAQQSAISQGQPLTNPGSTIVCIPSGYVFMVGGQFWQGTCGRAWGTNGNWPVNPYDFAVTMPTWNGTTKTTGFAFSDSGPALYVRSGVTVQLDGVVRLYPIVTGGETMTIFGIIDDQVADGSANNVIIQGSGTLDAAGDKLSNATNGAGYAIYAYVSKNLILRGFTLKNSVHWGLQLLNAPVWPSDNPNQPLTYTSPTVFSDAPSNSILLDSIDFIDCSLWEFAFSAVVGCIFATASGLTISNCTFTRCAKTAMWLNGRDISVINNIFNQCGLNPNLFGGQNTMMLGLLDGCIVSRNKLLGNPVVPPAAPYGGSGDIRIMGNQTPLRIGINGSRPPTPNYPIDYSNNIQVLNNIVQYGSGKGISCDGINFPGDGRGGFYSNIRIMYNTIDHCYDVGLNWSPTTWAYAGKPATNIQPDGFNYNVDIGSNTYISNGRGTGRLIFQPAWPVPMDLVYGAEAFVNNFYAPMLGAPFPGTAAGGGSSFFTGPFCIYPYPNLSTTGTWFVQRCPTHAPQSVATLVNGVPNYIITDTVLNEVPTGSIDGFNNVFQVQHAPVGDIQVLNTSVIPGVTPATNTANIVTGVPYSGGLPNQIFIAPAPPLGSTLRVSYRFSTIEKYVANS